MEMHQIVIAKKIEEIRALVDSDKLDEAIEICNEINFD
jgi:hypothetical protein